MSANTLKHYIFSSTDHIWKSRLSWKIAMNVFLTILIVQGAVLYFSIRDFEAERLNELKKSAEMAFVPLLDAESNDYRASPLNNNEVKYILSSRTNVLGFSIYDSSDQFAFIESYGDIPTLPV